LGITFGCIHLFIIRLSFNLDYSSFHLKKRSYSIFILRKHALTVFSIIKNGVKQGCLLAFYIGFLLIWVHAMVYRMKELPDRLEGNSLTLMGTIASIPELNEEACRFEFDIQQTKPLFLWKNVGRIRIRWLKPSKILTVGDKWQFAVKLKKPRGYANPGSFDNEKHFFQNRWVAEGYIDENVKPIFLESHWFSHPVDRLRTLIFEKMSQSLKETKSGGLIIALVIGIKQGISQAQWSIFRDTGTAHLIAISGLHVGLVASLFYFCIFWGYRLLPIRYLVTPAGCVAAWFSLIVAIIYSFLAGFSIPTQRALVMVGLLMFNQLTRRIHLTLWNYFLALGIVLLLDPFAALTLGFWLSFGAVGMILYGVNGSRLKPEGLWWKWGRAQWVVFLGLMPITLATFNQLSWISPISNMIAIPWVSFGAVPLALLGTVLLPITAEGARVLLQLSETILSGLWPFLEKCVAVPNAVWMSAECSVLSLILATIGVLMILMPKGFPLRILGFIWIAPLLLSKAPGVALGEVRFTLLDVGQGLAAVVETTHHVLVFDTGPQINAGFDTGERVVLPFLATRGRTKINTLVISHSDNDHIGGMQSIIKKMPVDTVITSEIDKMLNHPHVKLCYATQRWQWDGVEFEMLHPETVDTTKKNDHCCVLRVAVGQGKNKQTVLLTADIEAKSEKKLIERLGVKLKSSILVVPHHGSKTSSTLEFLQLVNPEYALIPVGYRNRYGHPKSEIVARYQAQGIKLFNTINDGAIGFILRDAETIETPSRYRLELRRYWQFISK
jgi:competence protein ComEC